jgi:hypothetical protein
LSIDFENHRRQAKLKELHHLILNNMPSLVSISKIDFPNRVEQQIGKEGARNLFAPSYP